MGPDMDIHIYIYVYIHIYVCMYACMHAWMYVCMYVCMYVSMYLCMYVSIRVYIYTYTSLTPRQQTTSAAKPVLQSLHNGSGACSCCLNPQAHLQLQALDPREPNIAEVRNTSDSYAGPFWVVY